MGDNAPLLLRRSSELGTQEYWDGIYQRELEFFVDTGQTGEIWYGEDTQERLVQWITEDSGLPKTAKIIDLGCGNGKMLAALHQEGFTALTGIDYSTFSIDLAQQIAERENLTHIEYQVCDIMSESEVKEREGRYDLCVDKGTYDTISLKSSADAIERQAYIHNIQRILASDGILLLTSCNWTQPELEKDFSNDFEMVRELAAPSFTFGGVKGQTVTTLIMKKRKEESC